MQLKSYLRGFGCGLFISAVLMGIAASYSRKTMTDEEIKLRAAELGMVEEDSVLIRPSGLETPTPVVQLNPDTEDTSESVGPKENTPVNDSRDADGEEDVEAADPKAGITEDKPEQENKEVSEYTDDKVNADESSEDAATAKAEDKDEYADEDRHAAMGMNSSSEGDTEKTEKETQTAGISEDETGNKDKTGNKGNDPEDNNVRITEKKDTYTLEISKGTSSDGVARLLKQSGLIDDSADFDSYLCKNGFDKRIQNGVFKIPSGAGYEEIAKIITRSK